MKERMRLILGIASLTFVEAMRSRLLVVAAIAGVISVAGGVLAAGASVWSRGRFIVDMSLLAASVVGHVVACAMSTGLLSGEVHRNSEYMLLCRPLTRAQFLVGRLLGIGSVLVVLTQSMGALMALGLLLVRAPLPPQALVASLVTSIEVFVTAALGALFAAASSRPLATTMTVLFYLAGQVADEVRVLAARKEGLLLGWLLHAGYHVLPDFSRLSMRDVATSSAPCLSTACSIVLYAASYVVVVTSLSCIVYERRATRLS